MTARPWILYLIGLVTVLTGLYYTLGGLVLMDVAGESEAGVVVGLQSQLMLSSGLAGVVFGVGLLYRQDWARVTIMVANLIGIPVGLLTLLDDSSYAAIHGVALTTLLSILIALYLREPATRALIHSTGSTEASAHARPAGPVADTPLSVVARA